MTDTQLPEGVSLAQTTKQLDALAKNLQAALFQAPLQRDLENTGITIGGDGTPHGISVKAHCLELRGWYEHVWLTKAVGHRQLGGRILFRQETNNQSPGSPVYQIAFDTIGNAKFGKLDVDGPLFNILPNSDSFEDAKRRLAIDLLAIFHVTMATVNF